MILSCFSPCSCSCSSRCCLFFFFFFFFSISSKKFRISACPVVFVSRRWSSSMSSSALEITPTASSMSSHSRFLIAHLICAIRVFKTPIRNSQSSRLAISTEPPITQRALREREPVFELFGHVNLTFWWCGLCVCVCVRVAVRK